MPFYDKALTELKEYKTLLRSCEAQRLPVAATGLSHIHRALLISNICRDLSKQGIVVVPDESQGRRLVEDLNAMGALALFYPLRDYDFFESSTASLQYEQERTGVLARIINGDFTQVVMSPDALMQYTVSPGVLEKSALQLSVGDEISLDDLIDKLFSCGYSNVDQVEYVGQFSKRGGILDVFSPDSLLPVRLEFWGDSIDSMSTFDIESQRRNDTIDFLSISPACEILFERNGILEEKIRKIAKSSKKITENQRTMLENTAEQLAMGMSVGGMDRFLPLMDDISTVFEYAPDAIVFANDLNGIKEAASAFEGRMMEDVSMLFEDGTLFPPLDKFNLSVNDLLSKFKNGKTIYLDTFSCGAKDAKLNELVSFNALQNSPWAGDTDQLVEDLGPLVKQKYRIAILGGNEKGASLIAEDLAAKGLPTKYIKYPVDLTEKCITVSSGALSAGFEFPDDKCIIVTHGYISGIKKKNKIKKDKNAFNSLDELVQGNYVVHSIHGIGVFRGIRKIETSGVTKDYITISYAGNDTLYVPVTQLDLVSKYIGPSGEDSKIKLSKLGGTEWQRSKRRVKAAVKDMAKELIALYSARMNTKGYAFSPDTDIQNDFERRFEFEETEDQLRCADEIKKDMECEYPMERLLCGDVGFGKTEVALRAAFKCISEGKQCALLVPTTILAWQHYQTVIKRMEGIPVEIGLLSRFRNAKQQAETIKRLARGECDMVIGTHRLLSKDVTFKDLGLMIVDEEQRFGVAQKEKLKEKYKNVDVLTLSATPIPRTLNMVMSGIRDMSVIEEAPRDRLPVQTYVNEYNSRTITDAILRELRRGGQVYYLHNRIDNIERTAASIKAKIPEARVEVAHGAMDEETLSDVWKRLIDGDIDVLVCTTIIETGVDVPNANTMIIEDADKMGLSQLHQLRGRIGRSPRRAYAYLTYRAGKALTEISEKRLDAIRQFTQFGSGLKIAMRDLEIRGAGDLLGSQQHGQMETVGYDMYLKLLEEAVKEEKGEKTVEANECVVDLQLNAHIPETYIEDISQRLYIYRRIAEVKNDDDVLDVNDELIDRYGEPPEAVEGLIRVALIRSRAEQKGITEISQKNGNLILYQNPFDMFIAGRLAVYFKGRVMINAGTKPYIAYSLKGEKPDLAMKLLLDAMDKAQQEKTEQN